MAVSRGYQRRVDMEAWLIGRYVYEALSSVLSAALGRKGKTPYPVPLPALQRRRSAPGDHRRRPGRTKSRSIYAADDKGGEKLGDEVRLMDFYAPRKLHIEIAEILIASLLRMW